MSVYAYQGPAVTQNTRGYNGGLVGPTIRINPGDSLSVQLTNGMAAEAYETGTLHNEYRQFDTTNLHTHGLHISGEPPGDSIFTEVAPGETYTYQYQLPASHMGGTFWYHPHHHGSTAVHAGGGAVGMIIVNDPPGSIPDDIANLEEVLLIMAHINMPELTTVAQEFEANCQNLGGSAAQCDDPVWANGPTSGTQSNVVLVNGMTEPVVPLAANRWYRVRMVFAAVDATLSPTLPGCTVKLLAKDGIYLETAPRDITQGGFMGPGNRADWAVMCPTGSYALDSGNINGRRLQGPQRQQPAMTQTLVTFEATDQGDTQCELSTFAVRRPCYAVDLRSVTTAASTTAIRIGPVPRINEAEFATSTTYLATHQVGTVVQLCLLYTSPSPRDS